MNPTKASKNNIEKTLVVGEPTHGSIEIHDQAPRKKTCLNEALQGRKVNFVPHSKRLIGI
jgi:hypothetical protein